MIAPDQTLLTRYLLGELSEDESNQIEQGCLDDGQIFEQLEAIEAELADDYVRGVLTGPRRKQFEKRLLNAPGGTVDLKLAKLITGGAGPRHSFFVQISAVAAALALAVGIGWLSLRHPSPKPAQPQVAKNIQSIAPPPQQAPAQPAIVKTPVIATFVLTPGSVRADGEANEIRIPPNAQQVRFRIDLLSNQYQTYDASLNRVEGQRLFVQTHIKPHPLQSGETLFILMPASTVPLGTSILTIRGVGKYVIHNSQN